MGSITTWYFCWMKEDNSSAEPSPISAIARRKASILLIVSESLVKSRGSWGTGENRHLAVQTSVGVFYKPWQFIFANGLKRQTTGDRRSRSLCPKWPRLASNHFLTPWLWHNRC